MTELNWDGKYKERKRQGPVRISLPFQTIETVNESAQDRQRTLEMFAAGRETEWRNRLIWGDKKYVLPSLLPEFAGKVDLICIDPPFDTGADFSFTATVPNHPDTPEDETAFFAKEPSIIEQKAYRDIWGRGLDSYLAWFYDACVLLKELLSDNGTIYVHIDWNVGHYAKVVADEAFDPDGFHNEIICYYTNKLGTGGNTFDKHHDTLLVYVKGDRWCHNPLMRPVKLQKPQPVTKKVEGERIWVRDERGNRVYEMGRPEVKVGDVWEVPYINPVACERVGYDTQKPEGLLERIIRASSNEGDLVLDCFVGSGTTPAVAEKLHRRWIACDLSRFAIHTTRKRLLGIPNVRPFVVQNLGKYERQAWQAVEFGSLDVGPGFSPAGAARKGATEARTRELAYRKFILDLYRATPITGYTWLHGTKAGRMVHVGAVDAPVTLGDVKAIAKEVWRVGGSVGGDTAATGPIKAAPSTPLRASVDILGWEFALELNETAKQVAAESRVNVAFKKIPHEALDKKAVEQGDIKFFELGALSVEVVGAGLAPPKSPKGTASRAPTITLRPTDLVIPIDDIPEEVRKAIKHWSQMVDYWAVDWDYKNDTFHNQWQSYRTRKDPKIELETAHSYPEPGKYTVLVKVIDILGNDTTKTLEVQVR